MEQHKELSNYIKNTHAELRKAYLQDNNFKKIWQEHCSKVEELQKYSESMKSLAQDIWDKQRPGATRIDWVFNACKEYFFGGGLVNIKQKEIRRRKYYGELNLNEANNLIVTATKEKLKLLDVGSCYNAFGKFSIFETTPIDLFPADKSVFKCDFLNILVSASCPNINSSNGEIHQLPSEHFDVVVFCLFLEYLPCPKQRHRCCMIARELLQDDGLLVIVTCDSHKQHRNLEMMRQWKRNIEAIGFHRNKYQKLDHLHCLSFKRVEARISGDWNGSSMGSECVLGDTNMKARIVGESNGSSMGSECELGDRNVTDDQSFNSVTYTADKKKRKRSAFDNTNDDRPFGDRAIKIDVVDSNETISEINKYMKFDKADKMEESELVVNASASEHILECSRHTGSLGTEEEGMVGERVGCEGDSPHNVGESKKIGEAIKTGTNYDCSKSRKNDKKIRIYESGDILNIPQDFNV